MVDKLVVTMEKALLTYTFIGLLIGFIAFIHYFFVEVDNCADAAAKAFYVELEWPAVIIIIVRTCIGQYIREYKDIRTTKLNNMESRQKVYIKGDSNRGNDVVRILQQCGGKQIRPGAILGDNVAAIYYIDHDGIISFSTVDKETAKIIMDNYREIKLPEKKWKSGDILYSNDLGKYAVCSNFYRFGERIAYITVSQDMIATFKDFPVNAYHLATPQEIEQFRELLHKHGKDWDAEKKQLVDWKWKPKDTEEYWFFTGSNTIIRSVWKDTLLDNKYFDFSNCFQTKKEAEVAAERVKKTLKGE